MILSILAKTSPFCFANYEFYHNSSKTNENAILNVKNISCRRPLIIGTFDKSFPGYRTGGAKNVEHRKSWKGLRFFRVLEKLAKKYALVVMNYPRICLE